MRRVRGRRAAKEKPRKGKRVEGRGRKVRVLRHQRGKGKNEEEETDEGRVLEAGREGGEGKGKKGVAAAWYGVVGVKECVVGVSASHCKCMALSCCWRCCVCFDVQEFRWQCFMCCFFCDWSFWLG